MPTTPPPTSTLPPSTAGVGCGGGEGCGRGWQVKGGRPMLVGGVGWGGCVGEGGRWQGRRRWLAGKVGWGGPAWGQGNVQLLRASGLSCTGGACLGSLLWLCLRRRCNHCPAACHLAVAPGQKGLLLSLDWAVAAGRATPLNAATHPQRSSRRCQPCRVGNWGCWEGSAYAASEGVALALLQNVGKGELRSALWLVQRAGRVRRPIGWPLLARPRPLHQPQRSAKLAIPHHLESLPLQGVIHAATCAPHTPSSLGSRLSRAPTAALMLRPRHASSSLAAASPRLPSTPPGPRAARAAVDNWQAVSQDFLRTWVTQHTNDATNVLKKPVVFDEFGKVGAGRQRGVQGEGQ